MISKKSKIVGLLSALGTLLRVQALADPARVKIVAT